MLISPSLSENMLIYFVQIYGEKSFWIDARFQRWETWIQDSDKIAEYLDNHYADNTLKTPYGIQGGWE